MTGDASAILSDNCEYTGETLPVNLGATADTIRVLTHNVFGMVGPTLEYIPPPLPGYCQCTPPNCPDQPPAGCEPRQEFTYQLCDDRLYEVGLNIATASPRYDIVAIQELYDLDPPFHDPVCSPDRFFDGIWFNGEYDEDYYWDRPAGDGALYFDGGQGIFSNHPTTDIDEFGMNNGLELLPVMGIVFTRVWLDDELAVDVYNVHLHSKTSEDCDQLCRYWELGQLRAMMHRNSGDSGYPVLVMGDFNIGGPNPEPAANGQCRGNDWYGDIMTQLGNPRDLWMETHPGESGSTVVVDRERIDYIFAIEDPYLTNSEYVLEAVEREDMSVVSWFIDLTAYVDFFAAVDIFVPDSFPVSDHQGLEATLTIRRRFPLGAFAAAVL